MKHRKQKKPSKKMRPSREKNWGRAVSRYHLSPEELAMAKAVDFTPAMMDEMVRGRKIKRGTHDKLPSRPATPSQVKLVKAEIRKRYAARYGTTPPPVTEPPRSQKARADQLAARGLVKLTVTIPAALRAHVRVECARAGLTLDDGVQAALEGRFPMGTPSPTTPPRAA